MEQLRRTGRDSQPAWWRFSVALRATATVAVETVGTSELGISLDPAAVFKVVIIGDCCALCGANADLDVSDNGGMALMSKWFTSFGVGTELCGAMANLWKAGSLWWSRSW